jgi:hypothetical protein
MKKENSKTSWEFKGGVMVIKGFKGFNKDFTCYGFKYEEGKEYKKDGEPIIYDKGFHYCENPFDVWDYYDLNNDNQFGEVEAIGDSKKDGNTSVTNHIKIVKKLALSEFVKSAIDYLQTVCKIKDSSQVATSGDYSKVATSGYYSKVATSGNYSQVATSGYSSQVATSGDSSKVATSDDYSQVATSGYSSQVATSGNYSQVEIKGIKSVGANIGINGTIKSIKGSWITLAEYNDKYECVCVRSTNTDGKKIKENVWYKLSKGKFVEVK